MSEQRPSPEPLDDRARLIRVALSRHFALAKGLRGASVYPFNFFLAGYGKTPAKRGASLEAAPFPNLTDGPFPDGKSIYRRLGFDHDHIAELYDELTEKDGVNARFDDDLLAHFFLPELWPVIGLIIADGPTVAAQKLQRLAWQWGQHKVAPNRRRPEGGQVSYGTIETRIGAGRAFSARLHELNLLGQGSPELAAWTFLPPNPRISAARTNTAVPAPPRPLARRAWRAWDERVRECLGCATAGLEAETIARLTTQKLKRRGFRPLRMRALLFMFLVVGGRVDAVSRLAVCDYDPARLCADGVRRPAIGLRPRKGVTARRWKPIPQVASSSRATCSSPCDGWRCAGSTWIRTGRSSSRG